MQKWALFEKKESHHPDKQNSFINFTSMDNNFSFKTHIQVRYAETDAMGVVHHATYPIWFEQARVDFFRAAGAPYDEVEREGFASPVL